MVEQTPKKKYYDTVITPKARAVYPRLNTPDTKFKAEGRYSTKIRLPEAEARAFLKQFEAISEENFAAQVAAHSNDMDKKTGKPMAPPTNDGLPFQLEMDKETKQPTGNILISFACNASYKDRTGKTQTIKPVIRDSKNTPIDVLIGGGSLIKVAFTPAPFYTESSRKAGVSFRIQAVQVLELCKFGEVSFETEEGGFVGSPETQSKEGAKPDVPQATGAGNF